MAYDGSLNFDTSIDTKGLNTALSGLGSAVSKAAVGAAAAFSGLSVAALKMGGDLEQNMGGSEAVFKEFAKTVQDVGTTAFETMGLSMSDFLATANKTGALFQGMGHDVESSMTLSTSAMQRAADVASIMGIGIDSAMEAVAGMAKNNFTMMDNLGVAMNDTALEAYNMSDGMLKALDTLESQGLISATTYELVSEAAGESTKKLTLQQKSALATVMFLDKTAYAAGNYAKENETLAGSLQTAGAAFSNFLSGAGGTEELIDALTNAGGVIIDNLTELLPRLTEGIGKLISGLSPQIAPMLQELVPAVTEGAVALFNGLVSALPALAQAMSGAVPMILDSILASLPVLLEAGIQIVAVLGQGLMDALPEIVVAAIGIITQLGDALVASLPTLIPAIVQLVTSLAQLIVDNLPLILDVALKIVLALADGILVALPDLIAALPALITGIVEFIVSAVPQLVEAGVLLFMGIVAALPQILEALVVAVPQIIDGIVAALGGEGFKIKEAMASIAEGIATFFTETIPNAFNTVLESIAGIGNSIAETVNGIWTAIVSFFEDTIPAWIDSVVTWFDELPYNIGFALGSAVKAVIQFGADVSDWVKTELPTIIEAVIEWFAQLPGRIGEWLTQAINGIVAWGADMLEKAGTAASNTIDAVIEWFTQLPGRIGEWLTQTITDIVTWGKDMVEKAKSAASDLVDTVSNTIQELPGKMLEIGKDIVTGLWEGIKSMGSWIGDKVGGFVSGIKDGFTGTDGFDTHSPSRWAKDKIGRNIPLGLAEGIDDTSAAPEFSIRKMIDRAKDAAYADMIAKARSASDNMIYRIGEQMSASSITNNYGGAENIGGMSCLREAR